MEPTEQHLGERLELALHVGRWKSSSKESVIRMLEAALEAEPGVECTCRNPERGDVTQGDLDRNCPLHGIVAQDDSRW